MKDLRGGKNRWKKWLQMVMAPGERMTHPQIFKASTSATTCKRVEAKLLPLSKIKARL